VEGGHAEAMGRGNGIDEGGIGFIRVRGGVEAQPVVRDPGPSLMVLKTPLGTSKLHVCLEQELLDRLC
jgi:hypothetical protein